METQAFGLDGTFGQDPRIDVERVTFGKQRGIGRDGLVYRSTQELPARIILNLATQVPQRHVQGTHGADTEPAAPRHR